MKLLRCLAVFFCAVGLFGAVTPTPAAKFEKYLLEDTNGLLTVNLKQTLGSPLYAEHFRPQVDALLKMDPLSAFLKDAGFDPHKDIERVTVVLARSCCATEVASGIRPVLIVEGDLDAAKVQKLIQALGKSLGLTISEEKDDDVLLWKVSAPDGQSYYIAQPEKGILFASASKDRMSEAIGKGAGKKKPWVKDKAMRDLVAKLDGKASAAWAATGDMVSGTTSTADFKTKTTKVEWRTLGEERIDAASGNLTVNEKVIKVETTLVMKDAGSAKGLHQAFQELKENGQKSPEADLFNALKVEIEDKAITWRLEATAEGLEKLVRRWWDTAMGMR